MIFLRHYLDIDFEITVKDPLVMWNIFKERHGHLKMTILHKHGMIG